MELNSRTSYAKGSQTKKKVLATAIKLISTKGYQNVTIDEICSECNVTKGAFYHHFRSKDSLLDQIHLDTDDCVERKIPELFKADPTLDTFAELSFLYAQMTESRGVEIMKQKFRNNLDSESRRMELGGFFDPDSRPVLVKFSKLYKELQQLGQVTKDYSFEYFFHYLIVTYDGVVLDWCYNNGSYSLPDEILNATKRYLLGFRADNVLLTEKS